LFYFCFCFGFVLGFSVGPVYFWVVFFRVVWVLVVGVPGAGRFRGLLVDVLGFLEDAVGRGRVVLGGVEFGVHGGVWSVGSGGLRGPVGVVGDIHGDWESLEYWWRVTEGGFRFFLGDYIDRGPPEGQVGVLARLLEALLEGEGVVLLRGNHEPPSWLIPRPHDYPEALRRLYGGEWRGLYELSLRLFDMLPYALLVEGGALLVHGGPPASRAMAQGAPRGVELLGGGVWPPPRDVLVEVLWSDPCECEEPVRPNHRRGVGSLWGPQATRRVLELLGVEAIIRGHEYAHAGYKLDHDGRVVTLFSRLGPPYPNERAAILWCPHGFQALVERIVEGRAGECVVSRP